ncbi:Nitrate/nitrite transporter [Abortiporus biennis]
MENHQAQQSYFRSQQTRIIPRIAHVWTTLTTVKINALNKKCKTLPVFTLNNQYSRNFHLSWLGFWVAFLSWFAFSPLIPEAVKSDLKLTSAQIGNSNVISLCATLIVRIIVGPLVDKYGPRKVMAGLLFIGAVPSGLVGTITTANGLYIIRFFIGILGGTFVPCQAWTTSFFDKNVVGTANALVGGWGNSGGGFTFIIMIALYNRLVRDISSHIAWRVSFVIVPVPILLLVAMVTLVFGTDHPNGKWEDRFKIPASDFRTLSPSNSVSHVPLEEKDKHTQIFVSDKEAAHSKRDDTTPEGEQKLELEEGIVESALDVAINRPLSVQIAFSIIFNPLTWLPALAYMTTFGYELAIDANLANVLFGLYKSASFGQTKAGYIAGIYGLLNICTRPLGGLFGDIVYKRFGVPGKKYLTLSLGIIQGCLSLGLGFYVDSKEHPSLAIVIVLFTITAIFNEAGNGANFSLVPHCNPNSNGLMSGLVGAMGNLGGIIFALIFRFQPVPLGKAFWISGILSIGVNVLLALIPVPQR